jgi:hypothetical protein
MKKKIASLTLAGLLFSCTTQLPGEAPESFSLIEPQDGLVIDEVTSDQIPILFSWEAPLNSDYYILSLQSTDVTRQPLLDTVVETNSVRLDLPANTEMNWLVSAVNGVFKSNSLQTHRLQIGEIIDVDEVVEEPLDEEQQNIAPTIIKENPPDGEEIAPNNDIPVIWSFSDPDGPEPLKFTIEFDTDPSFESPDFKTFDETQPNNQIWFPTRPNKIYFWRVHVSDGITTTLDEEVFSFKVLDN